MKQKNFASLSVIALAVFCAPLVAQDTYAFEPEGIEMQLDELEEKADEVVKVNLWGKSLEQGKRLLSLRKNVTSPMSGFLSGLKGVYRRTYRFGGKKAEKEDVEPIYQQLADDGWVPLIETTDRKEQGAVSVYSYYDNDEVAGVTVVSSEPGEVTVVKILGPVDLQALSDIGAGLGLPIMKVATTELANREAKLPAAKK